MEHMTVGALVTIRPEWQDPGPQFTYRVLELRGDRVLVEAQTGAPLQPTEVLLVSMLQA